MKPLLCPTWVPGGRKVKDQTFHFIYLGCKGDWPYLRKMMGLASGFRSLRLCHLCNEEVSQLYRPNNFHIFCCTLYPTRPMSFMLPKWINPRIGISLARKHLSSWLEPCGHPWTMEATKVNHSQPSRCSVPNKDTHWSGPYMGYWCWERFLR